MQRCSIFLKFFQVDYSWVGCLSIYVWFESAVLQLEFLLFPLEFFSFLSSFVGFMSKSRVDPRMGIGSDVTSWAIPVWLKCTVLFYVLYLKLIFQNLTLLIDLVLRIGKLCQPLLSRAVSDCKLSSTHGEFRLESAQTIKLLLLLLKQMLWIFSSRVTWPKFLVDCLFHVDRLTEVRIYFV